MAEFFTGDLLNHEILQIIKRPRATEIVLASPYIKFHQRIIDELIERKSDPNTCLIVLIGKSGGDYKKSIPKSDLEFLMNYPNVQIRHEERLHAKFYGNDFDYVVSSMNLYDFSQNTNIEFGIKIEDIGSILDNKFEKETFKFIQSVIERSELIYENVPVYEKKRFGLSSTCIGFENLHNSIDRKKRGLVPEEEKSNSKSFTDTDRIDNIGYCIRTGEEIKFDMKMPMTKESFRVWSIFKDDSFPEKYCHCTGEEKVGETSLARPVLRKNWTLAMKKQKL